MPRCEGRNQRTGERCRRVAPAGASVCAYHAPRTPPPAPRAEAPSGRLTTRVLSKATWGDFETLFAVGTGWGRCGCLFALDARRATRGSWADQRHVNLATMRDLVERGRSQGILVYDGGTPMGWCQFVPKDRLRFADVAASGADWFITCFVIGPRDRGRGVTGVALRAAVQAIHRRGGGIVEGRATAMVAGPPPKRPRKEPHVEDDVLYLGGTGRVRYGVEVEGLADTVAALIRSDRSMHAAPLGGTVDLFRREGFEPVEVLPRAPSALADRIVMRRRV